MSQQREKGVVPGLRKTHSFLRIAPDVYKRQEYCIRELFGDNTKIIIPDLQRDYCWGDNAYVVSSDKKPRELVSGFINNIVELYNENKELKTTLGLIYG